MGFFNGGVTNLLVKARAASGHIATISGSKAGGSPGTALTVERIHKQLGGVRGMASSKITESNGINSLRSMGQVLAKRRRTIQAKVDFDQVQYPTFGDADISKIRAFFNNRKSMRRAGPAPSGIPATEVAAGPVAAGRGRPIESAANPGVRAAAAQSMYGIANQVVNVQSNPQALRSAVRRSPYHPMIRSYRGPAVDEQVEMFQNYTQAASFSPMDQSGNGGVDTSQSRSGFDQSSRAG